MVFAVVVAWPVRSHCLGASVSKHGHALTMTNASQPIASNKMTEAFAILVVITQPPTNTLVINIFKNHSILPRHRSVIGNKISGRTVCLATAAAYGLSRVIQQSPLRRWTR